MNIHVNIQIVASREFAYKKRKFKEGYSFVLNDGELELYYYELYSKNPVFKRSEIDWGQAMWISSSKGGYRNDFVNAKYGNLDKHDWVKTESPPQTKWKKLKDVVVPDEIVEEIKSELKYSK